MLNEHQLSDQPVIQISFTYFLTVTQKMFTESTRCKQRKFSDKNYQLKTFIK